MSKPPDAPRTPAGLPDDPDAVLAEALARSRVMHEAPEPLIRRAIDLFSARRPSAAAPAPGGELRRLVAMLGFDSATLAPHTTGLRSAGSSARQMLFSAEGRDVDLRIAAGTVGWHVSGQVLGPDARGRIELQCGDFRAEQDWNELAEFDVDGVPDGCWRIVLRGDDWTLELPDLQVPGEGG